MIRINLLPFRAARKKENVRRQISVFLLSLVLIVAALFLVRIVLGNKVENLNTRIKEAKIEIEKYTKITQEIELIKKQIEVVKTKIDVIKKLEANRTEPVKLHDAMPRLIVPNRMWFTDFSSSGENVVIKGIAMDNKTVADFMIRLESSKFFSAVNLDTIMQQNVQNVDMKSFFITCNKAKK
jgi:type IV pilus assembly protein PilN